MTFLAVLAYPDEADKRDKFIAAAKAWIAKKWIESGTSRDDIPKEFRNFQNRAIEHKFDQAKDRIVDRRIQAAILAGELIFSASPCFRTATKAAAQKGRKKPGLNTAVDLLHSEIKSAGADAVQGNTRQRIWAESKPVIHLASAFWMKAKDLTDFGTHGGASFQRLIAYPHLWLEDTLSHAEKLRLFYIESPAFSLQDIETIQLIAG